MILDAIENDEDLNPKDKFGNTPLHEAAREGHYEVGMIASFVSQELSYRLACVFDHVMPSSFERKLIFHKKAFIIKDC